MNSYVLDFESKHGRSNEVRRFVNYLYGGVTPPQQTKKPEWDGAGILAIEHYRWPGSSKTEPCVILFGQFKPDHTSPGQQKYVYEEAGGARASNEQPWITAARELKEESCNLLRINKHQVQTCPSVRIHNYICYVVNLRCKSGIFSKYYHENKKNIEKYHKKNGKVPHEWRETTDMTRVPLSQFVNANGKAKRTVKKRGDIVVTDTKGNTINISGRCKLCILSSLQHDALFAAPTFTLTFQPFFYFGHPPMYLKGTKTYFN